jgi:biopolymer transport protein ExbD
MAGGGGGGEGEPEFQVAPMIDVLLVLLIFFMSITSSQVLKVDKNISLPVASHGVKRDDKAAAGLINISWDKTTGQAKYKLDDRELDPNDKEGIAKELADRMVSTWVLEFLQSTMAPSIQMTPSRSA